MVRALEVEECCQFPQSRQVPTSRRCPQAVDRRPSIRIDRNASSEAASSEACSVVELLLYQLLVLPNYSDLPICVAEQLYLLATEEGTIPRLS